VPALIDLARLLARRPVAGVFVDEVFDVHSRGWLLVVGYWLLAAGCWFRP